MEREKKDENYVAGKEFCECKNGGKGWMKLKKGKPTPGVGD